MNEKYTATAIFLHWLMAPLILAVFALGFYMSDLKLSPLKLQLFSYHKWAGITLLTLAALRIVWRMAYAPPPLLIARWQRLASGMLHLALYVLLLLVPVTGWLMSSAKGFQTVLFGILPLPDLVAKDKALGLLLQNMHQMLNYLLLALIAGHIAAALWHKLIARDDVMSRMLPK